MSTDPNGPYVRKDVLQVRIENINHQLGELSKDITKVATVQEQFARRHEEQHQAMSRILITAILTATFSLVVTVVGGLILYATVGA